MDQMRKMTIIYLVLPLIQGKTEYLSSSSRSHRISRLSRPIVFFSSLCWTLRWNNGPALLPPSHPIQFISQGWKEVNNFGNKLLIWGEIWEENGLIIGARHLPGTPTSFLASLLRGKENRTRGKYIVEDFMEIRFPKVDCRFKFQPEPYQQLSSLNICDPILSQLVWIDWKKFN